MGTSYKPEDCWITIGGHKIRSRPIDGEVGPDIGAHDPWRGVRLTITCDDGTKLHATITRSEKPSADKTAADEKSALRSPESDERKPGVGGSTNEGD